MNRTKKEKKKTKKQSNIIEPKVTDTQIHTLIEDISNLKQTVTSLKKENLNLKEENSYLVLENEKIKKIKDNEISTLNEGIVYLEKENNKYKLKNDSMSKQIDADMPKILQYDQMEKNYKAVSEDNERLQKSNTNLNDILTKVQNENSQIKKDLSLLRLENDNLKSDKMFLSKNNSLLEDKLKQEQNTIAGLENDIREMRKTNQSYIDKLTDKNISLDKTYKDEVNKELASMKEKYENDLKNIKQQYDEIYEKKTAYLSESIDEYKIKCKNIEKTLKDKDESLNLLQSELSNCQTKSNEQISFLKLQLNIKTEELNSKANIYEEQVASLTLYKNENENLKEKNDFLRKELIQKESDFRAELAEYRAKLANVQSKLDSYDHIENELDKAIADGISDSANPEGNEVLNVIKDVPTASKRRISQWL